MTSIYENDEHHFERPKKSKSGSLKPKIQTGGRGGKFAPQAMVKVAGWANNSSSVRRMLDYISRTNQKEDQEEKEIVALETEIGVHKYGKEKVRQIYEGWKHNFGRKLQKSVKAPRHAVHLVFSAKADLKPKNIEKTLRAAKRTLQEHFGEKGYKYAVGVHQDGKFPHVHAVVKTISVDDKQTKLRLGPKELLKVRKTLAAELTREGLAHQATRMPKVKKKRPSIFKGDKPDVFKRTEAVVGSLKREQRQFERRLKRENPSVNAFAHRRGQAATLKTLRKGVDTDSSLADYKRQKAFNMIREFRRDLKKKSVNVELEVKAALNEFDGKHKKWDRQVKDTEKIMAGPMSAKKRTATKDIMKDLAENGQKMTKNYETFLKKDLPKTDLPTERKKEIHRQTRSRFQDLRKTLDRVVNRSR